MGITLKIKTNPNGFQPDTESTPASFPQSCKPEGNLALRGTPGIQHIIQKGRGPFFPAEGAAPWQAGRLPEQLLHVLVPPHRSPIVSFELVCIDDFKHPRISSVPPWTKRGHSAPCQPPPAQRHAGYRH